MQSPFLQHRCNRDCRRHGCTGPRMQARAEKMSSVVPMFYRDQNQSTATPYEVTFEQAQAMQEAGRGQFINHKKAFQHCESDPGRPNFISSQSGDSDCSIALEEMQANVGIAGETRDWREEVPAPRHIVQRAQQKIRAIGRHEKGQGAFDDKAPLAFGGHVYKNRWANLFSDDVSGEASLAPAPLPDPDASSSRTA